ncbi:hypothetical protein HMPREF9440_02324 [Sutterella parvirubra YIT 11816]|uniref:Uncharacterized protein n=1 Tax=Sutterella parvirubra YIT 11816 TaxID=762967 RepID=H3KHS8_9BURK|nr:hypothetical protein HMPREF9440_02324 [Sutterella parvirubra YIT 11816]
MRRLGDFFIRLTRRIRVSPPSSSPPPEPRPTFRPGTSQVRPASAGFSSARPSPAVPPGQENPSTALSEAPRRPRSVSQCAFVSVKTRTLFTLGADTDERTPA